MGGRRKRPEAGGGPRSRRGRAPTPAGLAAWAIFLAGAVALGFVVWRAGHRPDGPAPAPADPSRLARRDGPPAGRPAAPRQASRPTPSPSAAPAAAPTPPTATPRPTAPPIRAERDLLAEGRRPAGPGPARRAGQPARLAIILDDIGQELAPVERAAGFGLRLSFAVIPHLPYSRQSADYLHQRGLEVMLHLPMEPLGYPRNDPGAGAVLSRMDDAEITRVVQADLAAVPHIRGVNNHMGSRVTAEARPMRAVLAVLSGTPYFFIDSRTIDTSVALTMAREMGIPSAERSVFLDDVVDRREVRAQLERAVVAALARGVAIAIGHPHDATLDVLAEELPRLSARGITLVFASEVVS